MGSGELSVEQVRENCRCLETRCMWTVVVLSEALMRLDELHEELRVAYEETRILAFAKDGSSMTQGVPAALEEQRLEQLQCGAWLVGAIEELQPNLRMCVRELEGLRLQAIGLAICLPSEEGGGEG